MKLFANAAGLDRSASPSCAAGLDRSRLAKQDIVLLYYAKYANAKYEIRRNYRHYITMPLRWIAAASQIR